MKKKKTKVDVKAEISKPIGPKSIKEILGVKEESDYATTSELEYEEQISKLNMIDLQNHAIKLGFRPSSDRPLLMRTLVSEFRKRNNALANRVSGDLKKKNSGPTIQSILEKATKEKTKSKKTVSSKPTTIADILKQ